jgi:hypothetical protein
LRRQSLGLFFLLATCGFSSYADSATSSVLEMQKSLEDRLIRLVQIYDPDATAFVELDQEVKKTALPYSPFLIDRSVIDDVGNIKIDRAQITVYNRDGDIPLALRESIREITRDLGVIPTIDVKKNPEPRSVPGDPKVTVPPPPPPESILKREQTEIWLGLACTLIALLFSFGVVLSRMGKKLARAIEALPRESERRSRPHTENRPANSETFVPRASTPTYTSGPPLPSSVLELSEPGVLAILSDCYWSSADAYASFLWRRIPVSKKKWVLEKMPHLGWFAESLGETEGIDLGFDQSPYYLNPLPIFHLDNQALLALVRRYPSLFNKIPELRKRAFSLKVSERIEISEAARATPSLLPAFEKIPASAPRKLTLHEYISIESVEEEEEVLAVGRLSTDWKQQILSLAWLLELPAAEIENALKNFSALELSEAWIGPEKVLNALGQKMAPKKLELIKSFLSEGGSASRQSVTFKKLHQFSVEHLIRTNTGKGEDEVTANKAA